MIGILDYGVGNVGAYLKIFRNLNIPVQPVRTKYDFERIQKIILPGVGAFDDAMEKLNRSGLREPLDQMVIQYNKPLLAVCIGMHMLGNSSEEGRLQGLGYIPGVTKKIVAREDDGKILLPHMGWNDITVLGDDPVWIDVDTEEGFYFLHSYAFFPQVDNAVIATSEYGLNLSCAVRKANIYGFQFHPEKSLSNGILLLRNFAERVKC